MVLTITKSPLLNFLLQTFKTDIQIDGKVITAATSHYIPIGWEEFGFDILCPLSHSVEEKVCEFYKSAYEPVIRGTSVHLKKNGRVVKLVIITYSSQKRHVEITIQAMTSIAAQASA